jgi:tetratricopeptide (TPR) repeat protein
MRIFGISLCLLVVTGCGSESSQQQTGTTEQAAGVTLAIVNPDAQQPTKGKAITLDTEQQQAVEQLIAEARNAVSARQNSRAIEALSQGIGIDPSDVRLLRMRADIYALSGELASARADFSSAILAAPADAELRNIRGYFLMTHGVTDDALKDFAEAIKLDPDLAVAWNNRGLIYLQQAEYDKAVKQFQAAVNCDREYVDGWNNLGFATMKQGNPEQALPHIEHALSLNPQYITAWNNRGLIHLETMDFEAACTAFTKAIEIAPLDPRWYLHRQVALRELKRFDDAAADAARIDWINRLSQVTQHLNRDTQDVTRWIARGDCLMDGNEYAAAIEHYTQALDLQSDSTEALNARARGWATTGDLRKAIDDCEDSIIVKPTLEALSIRGDAWLAMDNLDQAIEDFVAAERFDETVASTYRKRAERRQSNGDKSAAEDDLRAAQEIEDAYSGRLAARNTEPIPFPETE